MRRSHWCHQRNLDTGLLEVADGFEAIVEGVRGARLREEAAGAFEVVAVALEAGGLEAVGDFLSLDEAERGVGAGLAAGLHLADAVADLVEHRAFVQPAPRGDEADGGHLILLRLGEGVLHRLGVHEAILRRAGLVVGGLRAEAAILRARAGLGIDDGAEVNLVALVALADAVGPSHQLEDVGGVLQLEEPQRVLALDAPAVEHALAQVGKAFVNRGVKGVRSHG